MPARLAASSKEARRDWQEDQGTAAGFDRGWSPSVSRLYSLAGQETIAGAGKTALDTVSPLPLQAEPYLPELPGGVRCAVEPRTFDRQKEHFRAFFPLGHHRRPPVHFCDRRDGTCG